MITVPTTGRIVRYRGKYGLQTVRAAIVIVASDTLDPEGVGAGEIEDLDTMLHAHLWVFGPNIHGGFFEPNVPHSSEHEPGSWWWPDTNTIVMAEA